MGALGERGWLTFIAAVGTILSALAVLWIYPATGRPSCCSVLQCVAVYSNMLQCVAVCCRAVDHSCNRQTFVLQCVAIGCRVSHCVVVYCSVLQCVAVCCIVLQSVAIMWIYSAPGRHFSKAISRVEVFYTITTPLSFENF